ncbi:MAG: hypothetical protein V1841_01425 [Patescibacteria group bacterium]
MKKKDVFDRMQNFYDHFFKKAPFGLRFVAGLPIIMMAFLYFGIGAIIEAIAEAADNFLDAVAWKIIAYQDRRQRKKERSLKPLNFVL